MKKKNMKPIVLSALLALSFGAVSVGTTFALFTDVAEANVAVKAGEVKVTNEIQILEAKSLNDYAETVTGGTDVTYINGGTANVDNTTGKVTISRWTPGDSVTLHTTPVNGSNVKTKMRLRVVMSGDLAPALKVTGIKNNTNAFVISGKKTYCTAWTLTEAGVNPDAYDVKIEFPDSDNGEILFGSENKDNKYQGKEAEIHIYYEAVQGNAAIDDLLERVNSRLAEEEIIDGKANDTMHEAFADLEDLLTPADAKSNHFVWNYETDAFARESAVTADQYKYFKVADEYVTDFSMYASEAWTHTDVALTGLGFDAGAHTDIASITYTGAAEARENIIRTNSANTTLTIDDASTGTIYHYGSAGALNIIQCHTASYHENGKVAYAEIAKGRIVLEKGADVEEIHINKKENEQAFDTVIIANNGGAEELPERITRDAVEVSSQTLVVKVESNGSSENVYVYANGTTGTTEKVTEGNDKQNENVNSALGQLVLDNGSAGEKAQTAEQKAEAKQEVVNEAIENTEYKGVAISKPGEDTQLMTIEAFRDSVNVGNTYAGYTVKLLDNIDLKNANWIPIGNNSNPFSGIFDGQGFAISNFNVSLDALDAGLFGVIRGIHTESMKTVYTQYWDTTNSNLISGSDLDEPFETIVKNVTLRGVNVSTTKDYAGTLAGYAIDTYFYNINVASGSVYATNGKVGGVIGSSNGCTILNNLVTGKDLTVTGDKHTIGGIVGGVQRGYTNSDHTIIELANTNHTVLVENCTNNAHVVWDQNPSHSGLGPIGGIIGNAGSATGLNVVVYKCTNNGNIDINSGAPIACGIVGQSHSPVKVIYGCFNNGNITGDVYDTATPASGIAGITCVNDGAIIACTNTGTLTNNHENGNTYDIGSSWGNIRLEGTVYANVQALQEAINNNNNSTCKSVILKNVTVTNNTGTLSLPSNIETISSNTKVCDDVDLSGNVKGIYLIGLTQKVNVTRTIVFGGSNNNISVDEGQTIGNIHLQGDNNSFVNNGTMDTLTYGVYGAEGSLSAVNNGTMRGFGTVTGSYHMTFTNNGVISREDWHTFDIETDGSLIVHNYGTIHGKNGNPYALLLYGGCDVTFYAHSGSIVEGGLAAYSKAHTVIIYADAGTTINGNPWSSVSSKTYNVTVNQ